MMAELFVDLPEALACATSLVEGVVELVLADESAVGQQAPEWYAGRSHRIGRSLRPRAVLVHGLPFDHRMSPYTSCRRNGGQA